MPSLLDAIADRVRAGRPYPDMGGMHDDPPRPPASPAEVAAAEARLGFALPPLLRDIYLHVAKRRFRPWVRALRN